MAAENIDLNNLKSESTMFDYVWFTMTDLHGIARGKLIPSRHAARLVETGVGIYCGFLTLGPLSEMIPDEVRKKISGVGNMYAKPVVNKIMMLPWTGPGNAKIGEILCEPVLRNGEKVKSHPRYVAGRQVELLSQMGITFMSAFENEFVVTRSGEMLQETRHFCSTLKFSEIQDFLFQLDKNMQQCGVDIECMHKEGSPSQMEITFKPKFGMQTADDMFLFKRAVKEIARKFGLDVSFMAKPFKEGTNTSHFNHSLWQMENKTNLFYDSDNKLSQLGKYWIGGLIKHMDALTAVCRPTINCYRLLPEYHCGDRKDWDLNSRDSSLRVTHLNESATYVEERIPSGVSNAYLVMAATIAAGIDGIKNKIEPPPSGKGSNSTLLPTNLEGALQALESDQVLVEALGSEFVTCFLNTKRHIEVAKFGKHDMANCKPAELESERKEYMEVL